MHDNPLYSYTFLFVIFCCFFSNLYDFIVISFFFDFIQIFCIWFGFDIFANKNEIKSSTKFSASILKRKLLQNVMMNGHFSVGLIGKTNVGDKYCKLKINSLGRNARYIFLDFFYINRKEHGSFDPGRVCSFG